MEYLEESCGFCSDKYFYLKIIQICRTATRYYPHCQGNVVVQRHECINDVQDHLNLENIWNLTQNSLIILFSSTVFKISCHS